MTREFSLVGDDLPRIPFLRDALGEGLERRLDVHTRFRGREAERAVVGTSGLDLVVLRDLALVLEVDLVPGELNRDLPRHAVHALDPVVQVVQGLLPGDVAHGKDATRAVEVGLFEQFAEALLAHDVPDRHVDLQFARPVRGAGGDLLLRDLRAERLDVLVIEVVEDESPDEGGFPDGRLTYEADFHFHPLHFHAFPPTCPSIPGLARLNVMGPFSGPIHLRTGPAFVDPERMSAISGESSFPANPLYLV